MTGCRALVATRKSTARQSLLLVGGVEVDFDRIGAGVVEARDKAVCVGVHVPALVRVEAGEGDRAGEQLQRAAFGIVHLGRGGEGEGGGVRAEVAGEVEIVERDFGAGRETGVQQRQQANACSANPADRVYHRGTESQRPV